MQIRSFLWLWMVVPILCLADDAAKLDQVVVSYVDQGKFMGSVLVARGDDILLSKGYGSANLEWAIVNDPKTKFRLGSVTKQFTAAAILLLEERGKLKTSDLIKTHLPDTPAAWGNITIFHLLTHTSGIPNFTSFPDYPTTETVPATPEQLVARFRDRPLEFTPGEKWNYSNSGYVLLGYLIEKISGQSYETFIQKNIFEPLEMKDSGYDSNTAVISHRAAGYEAGATGPVNTNFIHMSIPFAAGALYSTTEDLLRWEKGLFGGKLLKPESLQKMVTPFKNDYAFGIGVMERNGHKSISHGGGIEGFRTHLAYFPEEKLTIVVLGNLATEAPPKIAGRLSDVLHARPEKVSRLREAIEISPDILKQYEGVYEITPTVKNYIRLEGDHLTTQLTGQRAIPIFAETETKFFLKVVDGQLEFVKDARGSVTHLVMYQNGHETQAQRMSDKVEALSSRKPLKVPVEKLKQYVGTYALSANFAITITLEGDQLMEQATMQQKFPIFPESETKFYLKVVDAQIEFILDGEGKVSALILHQNGMHQTGKRK